MLILISCFAFFVSFLGTIVGFGGGIFIVPIMVIFFDIPIEIAVGVTAISLFPSSLASTFWNLKGKFIDFKLLIALEIPTIIGAIIGAKLTSVMASKSLELIFSFFLFYLAYKTFFPTKKENFVGRKVHWANQLRPRIKLKNEMSSSLWVTTFFGSIAGMIAGLFGVGGGVIKTPMMLNIFKFPAKMATATSLCMIMFTSLSSGLTHWYEGHVDTKLLMYTVPGFLLGSVVGNYLSFKTSDKLLKRIIAMSILLAGLTTLIHYFS